MICRNQQKTRDVSGPQPYTFGLIAKLQNSNFQSRLMAIQKRMTDESSKDDEKNMKNNQRDIIKSKFHIRTDKKNFDAKVRNIVKEKLLAAEEDLSIKRKRLRNLLLSEEREYLREIVTQSQKVTESIYNEQKMKALECKARKEAEEAALCADKRLQQYINRCEELRTFREALNKKEVSQAVLQQIEDNKRQREADNELEKMWHDVAMKNYSLMVAYENEEERKRNVKKYEIKTTLQNQIKGRKLYEEETQRLKMEERAKMDQLRHTVLEQEQQEKRDRELKKQKLREEMEEVKRQNAELHARRKAQEKVLNDMFCQLIEQELKRDQEKLQDNKTQLRKESELFKAYLEETALKKKKGDEEAANLRAREVDKIDAAKHELDVKKCDAALKLKDQVLKERAEQMKAKEKQKEMEKRKQTKEARLGELLRLESLEFDKESQKAMEKKQKEYHMDLTAQIEENKKILLKQCEEEERQLREIIAREEAYFNKVKDIVANNCSSQTHPFLKKMQGLSV